MRKDSRIEHGALDARPGAHIGADLLAGETAKRVGRGCEDADEDVGDRWGLEMPELREKLRRVGEIEDERASRRNADEEPGQVRAAEPPRLVERPRRLGELHARVAVALPEPLHEDHQIGPDRLRAGVTAPDAARKRGDEKQRERRQDQDAGDVVEFLRPDFEAEEVKALMGEIEQHGLIGDAGSAPPTQPGQTVIDAQRDNHEDPLDPPEFAVNQLRIDGFAGRVEGLFLRSGRFYLGPHRSGRGFLANRRGSWRFGHLILQSQSTGVKGIAAAHRLALLASRSSPETRSNCRGGAAHCEFSAVSRRLPHKVLNFAIVRRRASGRTAPAS